jgi:hypothetical protein
MNNEEIRKGSLFALVIFIAFMYIKSCMTPTLPTFYPRGDRSTPGQVEVEEKN